MQPISARERRPEKFAEALADLTRKKAGQVTLTINVASTTVASPVITEFDVIALMPQHANAATELNAIPYCLITVVDGSFTINHVNSATANRTFRWAVVGIK